MTLAAQLTDSTPDHSLPLFDKGFNSLGLLHRWQSTGTEHHWLLPLKKGTQYRLIRKISTGNALVALSTSSQARKKWPDLPEMIQARLLSKTRNGKTRYFLTSITDTRRYPGADIVGLYAHRWETKLGYREMKQL